MLSHQSHLPLNVDREERWILNSLHTWTFLVTHYLPLKDGSVVSKLCLDSRLDVDIWTTYLTTDCSTRTLFEHQVGTSAIKDMCCTFKPSSCSSRAQKQDSLNSCHLLWVEPKALAGKIIRPNQNIKDVIMNLDIQHSPPIHTETDSYPTGNCLIK